MHKSAMLRYFETREEIFLRLTADGWREWSTALRAGLEDARGPDAGGRGRSVRQHAGGPRVVLRPAGPGAAQPGAQRFAGRGARLQAGHPGRGRRDRGGGAAAAARADRARRRRPHRGRDRDVGRVLADGDARARGRRALPRATLASPTRSSTSNRASPGSWRPCWRECSPSPCRHPPPSPPPTAVGQASELQGRPEPAAGAGVVCGTSLRLPPPPPCGR